MNNKALPPIYFYIPEPYWPNTMPKNARDDWKGYGIGIYAWTVQTYFHLKENDFPCVLTKKWPDEGIVLIHRDSFQALNSDLKPKSKILLICMKAEWDWYPYAQIHVVQNPYEANSSKGNYYIPLWPQTALIPRNPERGDRFENIAFLGNPENLASELKDPSWQTQLNQLGLSWNVVLDRYHWNDYSEIDLVLAVRSFDRQKLYLTENFITKPATKLYNTWCAGVPGIFGCEAGFQAERKSELDYLEVNSVEETISAIKRLQDSPDLRKRMVENGYLRAEEIKPEKIVAQWREFLTHVAIPGYETWLAQSSWEQELFLKHKYLGFKINRAQNKIKKLLSGFRS